jgi:hypothetical protein
MFLRFLLRVQFRKSHISKSWLKMTCASLKFNFTISIRMDISNDLS